MEHKPFFYDDFNCSTVSIIASTISSSYSVLTTAAGQLTKSFIIYHLLQQMKYGMR